MPHCFNAYDACDPDVPYYRGNGWYRTHIPIANPFKDGRTLLHFEGAGQTAALYIGEKLAGKHTGGYDGADYIAHETFGIRHTDFVQHGPFNLNGERLLLRGTHRHEDHAGYAAAIPDDLINQEMQLIKDMGVNFIRLAHYEQSRRVL
jgi:beta-galactosidase/beta-glucuronidase